MGLDDAGNLLYGGSDGWLYLNNNNKLIQIANGDYAGGLSMSDNGQMVWTQWVNNRCDVWTFVNGTATNITQGLFGDTADALYPDINDHGDIVFMVTTGTYTSDIYLWSIPEPASLALLSIGLVVCLHRSQRTSA